MAWTDIRLVTIDHTMCGATDDSNYPVLFTGTYATLAATGSGGVVTSGSGYDLGFYSDISGVTARNWELVSWNSATGFVEMYWLEPSVSHSADTADTYRCAGNASITTDQSNKTGVWDANFVGVYHLGDGTTVGLSDSTSNANTLTNHGATAVTGQVGGGVGLDGTSQYLSQGSAPGGSTTNFTASAWVKWNGTTPAYAGRIFSRLSAQPIGSGMSITGTALGYTWNDNSASTYNWASGITIASGAWNFTVTRITSTEATIFCGAAGSISSAQNILTHSSQAMDGPFDIAYDRYGGSTRYFGSATDEVRISKTNRSDDWVTKDYNNQYSPSTFYTMGSNLAGAVALIQPSRVGRVAVRRASFYSLRGL